MLVLVHLHHAHLWLCNVWSKVALMHFFGTWSSDLRFIWLHVQRINRLQLRLFYFPDDILRKFRLLCSILNRSLPSEGIEDVILSVFRQSLLLFINSVVQVIFFSHQLVFKSTRVHGWATNSRLFLLQHFIISCIQSFFVVGQVRLLHSWDSDWSVHNLLFPLQRIHGTA